jgi:hypothetical protein
MQSQQCTILERTVVQILKKHSNQCPQRRYGLLIQSDNFTQCLKRLPNFGAKEPCTPEAAGLALIFYSHLNHSKEEVNCNELKFRVNVICLSPKLH